MDDFLKSLKVKETELVGRLEQSPLFIQLESLRKTIAAFEGGSNGSSVVPSNVKSIHEVDGLSSTYNPDTFTWKDRVLFIIRLKSETSLAEIVNEIKKLEPKQTNEFLYKRVGVTLTQLKAKDKILSKRVNKKFKYFLP